MPNQILVPSLGESITEATVSKWLKQVGETVESDEPLVELETDKVNVEVPSPLSGTLSSIKVKEGSTVEVGTLLGVINELKSNIDKDNKEDSNDQKSYIPPKTSRKPKPTKNKKKNLKEEKNFSLNNQNKIKNDDTLILDTLAGEAEVETFPEERNEERNDERYVPPKSKKNLSPSVRKIVEENNIDLLNIEGTGKSGRISKGDLVNLMGSVPEPSARKVTHGQEERVKMTRLRATIAKRLKESQESSATLTTFNEVDMQNIIEMRKNYQEDFQKKYSVKLGFMSFFVKASVVALKNFPAINAEIENEHIIYKNYYNISIAIGTERGLVVPVLKKADELSFADIERNIHLLSEKAAKGKITINDLQGGTFTISNGGIYGSMLSTPIINPPQTGILGMHNVVDRPVVKDGNVVIRPIMYLALSYDHRIIDGKEAVSFLKTVKECLEEPRRLFLDL
jgi:2-oxoglutarate dehydrogenase E2 component (dihydrolipoamide succinyltransferase)